MPDRLNVIIVAATRAAAEEMMHQFGWVPAQVRMLLKGHEHHALRGVQNQIIFLHDSWQSGRNREECERLRIEFRAGRHTVWEQTMIDGRLEVPPTFRP